jgi:hypothetical protein
VVEGAAVCRATERDELAVGRWRRAISYSPAPGGMSGRRATAIERYRSSVERARHDQTPHCSAAVHELPRRANGIDGDVSASIGTCTQTGPPACALELCDVMGLIRAQEASLLCRIRRR